MKKLFFITSILFLTEITIAGSITTPKTSPYGFIENKGQIIDQNNNLNPAVKYLFNSNGLNVQLRANGFSYDTYRMASGSQLLASGSKMPFAKSQEPTANSHLPAVDSIFFHRVDIEFINANKNPQLISEQPSSDYTNYYTTGTPEEGVTNVRTFQKVTYKNIYNGIDLEFSTPPNLPKGEGLATAQGNSPLLWRGAGGAVKFNFIIHPGADVSQIRWKYNGAFSTSLTDGKIILQLAQGNLEEKIPESFLQETSEKVNVNYISFGENKFGFSASSFNKNATLVIDPVPWATYFGGSGEDNGRGVVTDTSRNVLITGRTYSTSGIATTGAFQTTFGGNYYDAFILKLNVSGTRQWSTYYGGSNTDEAFAIATDKTGNIFITGFSDSPTGIASTGAYQTSLGGSKDAFIIKFNTSGTRLWATYYGGSAMDNAFNISIDPSGNLLVSGVTYSTSGIASSGAYQTSNGGSQDAFIVKFNSSGTLQWGTYYGGSSDESANVVVDTSGNIIISGYTTSTSGIATTGAYQTSFGGSADAYVAKFSASGSLQWGTYYGGSASDNGYDIASDLNGNIFITGFTVSTSGIATTGAFQTSNGGSQDAFIVKFNSSGLPQWGTYFGGSGNELGWGIITDRSGNVFITGYTNSSSGIATTGAYQTSLGGLDALIAKFDSSGARLWATYYGGSGNDQGIDIASDAVGNVFITGQTTSTSGIATMGAQQATYAGGTWDAFTAAFTASGGLPVKLISFDAKLENKNEVLCTWATASETNNDYFEVERKSGSWQEAGGSAHPELAEGWEVIGKVKGHGTSNSVHSYQFTDHSLSSVNSELTTIYYRLKQVDFDGKFEYSNVVSVTIDKANLNEIIVSPNPTSNNLNIQTTSNENYSAQLFDVTGKLIQQESFIQHSTFNIQHCLQGIYFLRITNENSSEVKTQKVVVMK